MSLEGKNRAVYSYNNKDKGGSNFMYKDFEKSNSYHTDFSKTNFSCASLRAAKMKFCNFNGAVFKGTEFVGTNLRGSTFINTLFEQAIFSATVLDETNFRNATFHDCFFVGTGIVKARHLNPKGITFLDKMPDSTEFSEELLSAAKGLRENDIIRRSHTLHLKKGHINTLSLKILVSEFGEDQLIQLLPHLPENITTQFYTVSYLKMALKKML